jgi:hypothetical protein
LVVRAQFLKILGLKKIFKMSVEFKMAAYFHGIFNFSKNQNGRFIQNGGKFKKKTLPSEKMSDKFKMEVKINCSSKIYFF